VNTPHDKRRPINKLRDGAGSFEIGTPDDDSAISEIISTGDRPFVVKGKGIYVGKLAEPALQYALRRSLKRDVRRRRRENGCL
jgi:hypothetical protein